MPEPRIAFFDVETAPIRAFVWENFEANVIKTDHDWYMLSFSVKWAHEKKGRVYALCDYPGYRADKECDLPLIKDLWKLFDEADILIAHNAPFDIKKSTARFIAHGMKPPSGYKVIDTLAIARRVAKFASNKLSELGRQLKIGGKVPHTGASLWFGCMAGDMRSWATMKKYNLQDTMLLEKLYLYLRPWAPNHPNLNIYTGADGCPTCQSHNVQRRGTMVKLNTRRHRFHCQSCGAWYASKERVE